MDDGSELLACAGLDDATLTELALATGFCQRHGGKIRPASYVEGWCRESVKGTVSYNDLAASIHRDTGVSASRQAYWAKTTEACVPFFQGVLERVMLGPAGPLEIEACKRHGRFKRILVQDSTILQLPAWLYALFSGVKNAHATVCNVRIQGIYDLLSGCFIHFSIDPYSRNDQAAAFDLPLEASDLDLRDRGYFNTESLAALQGAGAECITRYKHGVDLFDAATGEKLDVLERLRRDGRLDGPVLVGDQRRVRLRLVAVPVREEVANVRRMKARLETKGHAPSPTILALMSWTILLTTLTDPAVSFDELLALYGLRWRIEIIFKTWKSHLHFALVHHVSALQARVLLLARLIVITAIYQRLFTPLAHYLFRTTRRHLSLLKFTRYASAHWPALLAEVRQGVVSPSLQQALVRYCSYDRRNRSTFPVELEAILAKTGTDGG